MSSKESLTKSHSSSSLLLNNSIVGWTQPSTGILLIPTESLETKHTADDKSDDTFETKSIGLSKNTSNASLDNFQTISLDNNTNIDNSIIGSAHDLTPEAIPDYLLGLQQMSIRGNLFSRNSSTPLTANTSKTSSVEDLQTSNIISDNSNQNTGQYSNASSFGSSDFSSNQSSEQQSVQYSETFASNASQSQTQSQPLLPPKGFVSKDFKIKGPLRLYDPNYGIRSGSGSDQTIGSAQLDSRIPYSQPIDNITENQYNPYEYTQNIVPNDQSLYDPQQYIDSTTTRTENSNSTDNSFISQTNLYSDNNNEWAENVPIAQPIINLTTDDMSQYNSLPIYAPVIHHWFYQIIVENREVWKPFSVYDSYNLEKAYNESENYGYGVVIATDGGRFDVNIYERLRRPVFWTDVPTIVRRSSWFSKKEGHNRYAPYSEEMSAKLEECFRDAVINNGWNQRIEFPGQEVVVMHSYQNIYHYQMDISMPDDWGSAVENPVRPRHVHRGAHEVFDDIEEGEPAQIDHLLFLIHGIGEICDFRFRSIVEVVDDFRSISLSLIRTHYKSHSEAGQVGRIELLPISWHSALHGQDTGIDERLKLITLESIPKLRHFSNDTILDALFYTSPLYCQKIVDNVGSEMNRLFLLFKQRNPGFCGTVALGGHSLGSLILFDLLTHQTPEDTQQNSVINSDINPISEQLTDIKTIEQMLNYLEISEYLYVFERERIDFETLLILSETDLEKLELPIGLSRKILKFIEDYKQLINNKNYKINNKLIDRVLAGNNASYTGFESMGIGFTAMKYPKLDFNPSAFFAMGSPIAMFLTVRGIETIGADFQLPTCRAVYNIYHPFDPIAYRIEPMIDPQFKDIKPVLIPHHKGRKRMHLELKESITRMGTDIKQKFFDSIKYTWNSINEFARAHKPTVGGQQSETDIDSAVTQMVEQQLGRKHLTDEDFDNSYVYGFDNNYNQRIGLLNNGRRIDYVLQEKPIEIFNEYIFAMASHACYWESEDTCLVILRELYGQIGFNSCLQQKPNQSFDSNFS